MGLPSQWSAATKRWLKQRALEVAPSSPYWPPKTASSVLSSTARSSSEMLASLI